LEVSKETSKHRNKQAKKQTSKQVTNQNDSTSQTHLGNMAEILMTNKVWATTICGSIKGHYDMWFNWLPILHRHASCGSQIMHGCTKSRLQFVEGTAGQYQIRAPLKDPVLNAKVYPQQATSRPALIQRMAKMQTRLWQHLGPL
jgi:hypothetical protein